jgi:dTDP-4-amino-4,6-dideoxygalactose transaminase
MQFNDLGKQWEIVRTECLQKIDNLGYKGSYILGKEVSEFEEEFCKYFGSKYAVGVSNGTDGLKLALQTFDLTENDCVIIPANTYIADYLAVKNLPGTTPTVVLIDINQYFTINTDHLKLFLKECRHKYDKVVAIPVHLYGQSCDMDVILNLSEEYDFDILEDCSQSHGTQYKGIYPGGYGKVSVYSLYPGKNLGAIGDAGIITTDDETIYERLKMIRNYGSKVKYYYDEIGHNHRLDTIQAIILKEKLKYLERWTSLRSCIASQFMSEIHNDKILLPVRAKYCTTHSFHIFCLIVDDRNKFANHMQLHNIPTIIHYPVPIHKTKIFESSDIVYSSYITDKLSDVIISIPIHPFLTDTEIEYIIKTINEY